MSMSLLEQVLKLPKKNSPLVISILLGIIIVGSIGGGLWINNLQNTLAERDALANERLRLIEERYKTNFNTLALRVDNVEKQFSELQTQANWLIPNLKSVSQSLTEISSDQQVPSKHRTTLSQLSVMTSTMSADLELAMNKLDSSLQNLSLETQPLEDYGRPPLHLYVGYEIAILIICFGFIILSLVTFRYLKKHLKITWQK